MGYPLGKIQFLFDEYLCILAGRSSLGDLLDNRIHIGLHGLGHPGVFLKGYGSVPRLEVSL